MPTEPSAWARSTTLSRRCSPCTDWRSWSGALSRRTTRIWARPRSTPNRRSPSCSSRPSRAPASQSGSPADAPRRRRPGDPRLRSRAVRARADRDRTRSDIDGAGRFYVCSLDRQRVVVYKGPPQGLAARRLLSGPDRRALREPRRLGPRALLDEHARRVAPRAPVPQHRPQRRVQHDPRERQLDARRENDLDHPAFGAELDTIAGR